MKTQNDTRNIPIAPKGTKATKSTGTGDLVHLDESCPDTLTWWQEQYFKFEVTTSPASQRAQRRDITHFILYMFREDGSDDRARWTPRLSGAFQSYLKSVIDENTGRRQWGDSSVKRTMTHLKAFSKWINKLLPFPLGDPMVKISTSIPGTGLEIERALTPAERRRILDVADLLPVTGGRSRDRSRHRKKTELERPQRKGFRPYRNRAIIYTLVETGMRRAGVINITLIDIELNKQIIRTREKCDIEHSYHISKEGVEAIQDYLEHERQQDHEKWQSITLFLAASTNGRGNGTITHRVINTIWNDVCQAAGIEGKTPHSARHAMGRIIIEKTGNIAAVQRQLGHRNAKYSMQYARITGDELNAILDKRG
jgi:site-specific recombinase XerD